MKKMSIIISFIFVFFLIFICSIQAATSNYIVGSPDDVPYPTHADLPIMSVTDQQTAIRCNNIHC